MLPLTLCQGAVVLLISRRLVALIYSHALFLSRAGVGCVNAGHDRSTLRYAIRSVMVVAPICAVAAITHLYHRCGQSM